MRQIYYSIRTLLRERGTNIIRVISLSLGLTIGILLFSQIAFELSYEHCYPEPERLAIARCLTTNLSTGETMGDDGNNYDYTLFDVVASTLAQDMPEEIEFASCVLTGQGMSIYYEDKLLSDVNYIYADTCFFQTFGIPVLKGNPKDMIMPGVCLCQSILPVKRLEMRTLLVKFLKQTGKMILLFVVYTRICRRIRCSLTTLLSPSIGMEDIREDMAGKEMMSFTRFSACVMLRILTR